MDCFAADDTRLSTDPHPVTVQHLLVHAAHGGKGQKAIRADVGHQKPHFIHVSIQLKPMGARLLTDEVYQHISHRIHGYLLGGGALLQLCQYIGTHGILPAGYTVQSA